VLVKLSVQNAAVIGREFNAFVEGGHSCAAELAEKVAEFKNYVLSARGCNVVTFAALP